MQLRTTPKQLFLIDGIGALLSAFFLGIVLVAFEPFFGMPKNTLYALAIAPCFFAVYSFSCYFFLKQNRKPFLRAIAIANLLYCCATIWLVYCHYLSLTGFGWAYFVLELLIILMLVGLEFKCAVRMGRPKEGGAKNSS